MSTPAHQLPEPPISPPDDQPNNEAWREANHSNIQMRAIANALEIKHGCFNDGREVVDEAWGEERTPAELRDITSDIQHAAYMGDEPDYCQIGKQFVSIIHRYALKCCDLDEAARQLEEAERDSAEEARYE